MRIEYHVDARADVLEAVKFYDERSPGLGSEFLGELDRGIRSVEEHPLRYAVVEDEIRQRLLKRFPYAIYYRPKEDEIEILAVKHHSRHPDYWKYRK